MNDQVISMNTGGGFLNLNTTEPLDSEITIPTSLVETFTDTDLFKYFLTEDLSSLPETNTEFLIPQSPSSSVSLDGSSDSPQPSPPQLSPENSDVTYVSQMQQVPIGTQAVTVNSNPNVLLNTQIKQEGFVPTQGIAVSINNDLGQKAKNSRKRERPTKETDNAQALTRDDLLKLSSKGLETYAQNFVSGRQLSPDEEKQLKRQKRLIKNRESAQLS